MTNGHLSVPRRGILFAFIIVLFAGPTLAQTSTQLEVVRNVNLREKPTVANNPIELLEPHRSLVLISLKKRNGYYHVRVDQGKEGWVWASNVRVLIALGADGQGLQSPVKAKLPVGAVAPTPLLAKGHPVAWWFVFKLNSKLFPGCNGSSTRACPFGGTAQNYRSFGQQFIFASSENQTLQKGMGCAGDTSMDPLGSTFEEVYEGRFHFVVWNDQFYDDPKISGCGTSCGAPWGHSKGMVVWNDEGQGFVMQVTTPSWPASGSYMYPRNTDGNTLGCVKDNNVLVSQHFFALKINKGDLVKILKALQNASVVTDPSNPQIVNNGGPADIQQLVKGLGVKSSARTFTEDGLSSGVKLISKPSNLHVPPWQLVSSLLNGVSLRTATWWANPKIPTTTASTEITCWDAALRKPGPVQIATTGQWDGKPIGLTGGPGPDFNHAKIGVSISGNKRYAIFGDMNQQGTASGQNCGSSQNGRGGLFYVIDNARLSNSITALINGGTAPTAQ